MASNATGMHEVASAFYLKLEISKQLFGFFAGTLTALYGIASLDEARAYLARPRAWATS